MDIFEQVEKLLKDKDIRERRNKNDLPLMQAALMEALGKRYNQCVQDRQWKQAYECLTQIFTLVGEILSEAAGK